MNKHYQKISTTVIALSMFLSGCSSTKPEEQVQTFEIEYGSTISVNPADYFVNESKDSLKNIKLDSKTKIENEKGKKYPALGEYTLTFQNSNKNAKDKELTIKVVVKDSTKPTFVELQKEYKVKVNDKLKKELFVVSDVSKVEVTLDDSKVDYSKEGTYKAILKAIDGSKNETTQEITVVVSAEAKSVDEQVKETESKVQSSQSTSSNSTTTSKPKPSQPQTNNNTTVSKPSTPSTPSKPSGGNNTNKPSKPSKPTQCKHQWLKEYDIVYHDPVYGTEKKWIVDEPAHEEPIYNTIVKTWCYGCNAYFDFQTESEIADHLNWHMDRGDRVYNYRFEEYDEIVGYESVPEKGHYEEVEVVIKEGYQETVLVRTYCGDCGLEK